MISLRRLERRKIDMIAYDYSGTATNDNYYGNDTALIYVSRCPTLQPDSYFFGAHSWIDVRMFHCTTPEWLSIKLSRLPIFFTMFSSYRKILFHIKILNPFSGYLPGRHRKKHRGK